MHKTKAEPTEYELLDHLNQFFLKIKPKTKELLVEYPYQKTADDKLYKEHSLSVKILEKAESYIVRLVQRDVFRFSTPSRDTL